VESAPPDTALDPARAQIAAHGEGLTCPRDDAPRQGAELLDGVVAGAGRRAGDRSASDTDPDPDADKAAQIARAAELRAKHKTA